VHRQHLVRCQGSNETTYALPSYARRGSIPADLDGHGAILCTPEPVDRYAEQPGGCTTAGDSIGSQNPSKGVGSKELRVWHLCVDVDAGKEASQGAGLGHAA